MRLLNRGFVAVAFIMACPGCRVNAWYGGIPMLRFVGRTAMGAPGIMCECKGLQGGVYAKAFTAEPAGA